MDHFMGHWCRDVDRLGGRISDLPEKKKEARIWGGQFICFWCGIVFFIYQHDKSDPSFYCYLVLLNKNGRVICKPTDQENFSSTLTGRGIKTVMVAVLAQIKDLEDANAYVNDMEILKSGFMEESECLRLPVYLMAE